MGNLCHVLTGSYVHNLFYWAVTCEFIFTDLTEVFFVLILISVLNETNGIKKIKKGIMVSFVVYSGLILLNVVTGSVYSITDENIYVRGPHYIIFQSYTILNAVLLILALFLGGRKSSIRKILLLVTIGVFIPISALTFQFFFYGIPIAQISIFFCIMGSFFYINYLIWQDNVKLQQQLDREEAQRLVMQLQPHFMYNALIAIMNIEGNPDQTVQAISSFAHYLRGNLGALDTNEAIPFSVELRHVKAYVSLEMLRFKGKLELDWEIHEEDFQIPPLSLEMLVENAIRHGFSGMERPGRIHILSRREQGQYIISVEDDGVGFDPEEIRQKAGSHVGLQSVKHRVEDMCGGKLEIVSRKGEGSRISILIPVDQTVHMKKS